MNREEQDALYSEARVTFDAAIRRLARSYEADPDLRRDLLQEIHFQLWRSLRLFDGECSLKTWVYRVAHNVSVFHIARARRSSGRLVDLDAMDVEPTSVDAQAQVESTCSASKLLDLIYKLKPLDRQIILLYLEGEGADSIAQVTGLSASNIATKVHRIKKLLNQQYFTGHMRGNEPPRDPGAPESVWKALDGKEEGSQKSMSTDAFCAMARSRERENVWFHRIGAVMLTLFAAAFAYNSFVIAQPWIRLGQVWMFGVMSFLAWKIVSQSPRRMGVNETCISFLTQEFQRKRDGYLHIRRISLLILPAILASWWGRKEMVEGTAKSLHTPAFVAVALTLVLVWCAFGMAAAKANRELETLSRDIDR